MNKVTENLIILQSLFGAGSIIADKMYLALKQSNSLNLDFKSIISKGVFNEKEMKTVKRKLSGYNIANIFRECKKSGIRILTIEDNDYPEKLKSIPTPPLVLYIKGEFPNIDSLPTVCIVGPREISEFGKKAAYSIARRISRAGIIVVSGGAKGGDRAAHIGALDAMGKTIAVLPCGINYGYLAENKEMRDAIAKSGCLISEYPPSDKLPRNAFQVRNRLLSGLCDVTLVTEAKNKSGTLITARHAAEQGRDVLVIPGNPTLPEYKASNELLRDGALPFIDTYDIFNLLITKYPDKIDIEKAFQVAKKPKYEEKSKKSLKKSVKGLSKDAEIVYNYLDRPKFSLDDLANLNLSPDELLAALTELEFEHLIKPLPGGSYSLL